MTKGGAIALWRFVRRYLLGVPDPPMVELRKEFYRKALAARQAHS